MVVFDGRYDLAQGLVRASAGAITLVENHLLLLEFEGSLCCL